MSRSNFKTFVSKLYFSKHAFQNYSFQNMFFNTFEKTCKPRTRHKLLGMKKVVNRVDETQPFTKCLSLQLCMPTYSSRFSTTLWKITARRISFSSLPRAVFSSTCIRISALSKRRLNLKCLILRSFLLGCHLVPECHLVLECHLVPECLTLYLVRVFTGSGRASRKRMLSRSLRKSTRRF